MEWVEAGESETNSPLLSLSNFPLKQMSFDLRLGLMLNARFHNLIEKEEAQCSRRGAYKDINWCSGHSPPHILSGEVNLAVRSRPAADGRNTMAGCEYLSLIS
jgi:hypothetical protein